MPRTLTQMAGRMWNHSPQMWAAMKAKGIERPTFEGKEMADLIAFLYSVHYSNPEAHPSSDSSYSANASAVSVMGATRLGENSAPT